LIPADSFGENRAENWLSSGFLFNTQPKLTMIQNDNFVLRNLSLCFKSSMKPRRSIWSFDNL
jgi:hypothetical protein